MVKLSLFSSQIKVLLNRICKSHCVIPNYDYKKSILNITENIGILTSV